MNSDESDDINRKDGIYPNAYDAISKKIKTYDLVIHVNEVNAHHEDTVEAKNKDEAAKLFAERMPAKMKTEGWNEERIIKHYIRIF